jgi:hypothetical protein
MTNRSLAAVKAAQTRKARKTMLADMANEIADAYENRLTNAAHEALDDKIADAISEYESSIQPVIEEANEQFQNTLIELGNEYGWGFVMQAVDSHYIDLWDEPYDNPTQAIEDSYSVEDAYEDLEKNVSYLNETFPDVVQAAGEPAAEPLTNEATPADLAEASSVVTN